MYARRERAERKTRLMRLSATPTHHPEVDNKEMRGIITIVYTSRIFRRLPLMMMSRTVDMIVAVRLVSVTDVK